jgi:hypothetical protein
MKDERVAKYDQAETLKMLQNKLYHSPEISETDDENPANAKRNINVYDLSWRSEEVINVFYFDIWHFFIFQINIIILINSLAKISFT